MSLEPIVATSDLDPASIKTRFKQRCLATNNVYQNWQIRVHRALSWYKRALELPEEQSDLSFMLLWIALNALYGRWDVSRNAPAQDGPARDELVKRVCEWDPAMIGATLRRLRALEKKILENFFLANTFWRDPENPKSKSWSVEDAKHLDRNHQICDTCRLQNQIMSRLYVMRGQLVHGAATGGGKLNRKTLGHCVALMRGLVPVFIHICAEKGAHDDWPELCYPPLK
jgi:hypothetical protein